MSINDILIAAGHSVTGGCCEKCWQDAATMYAGGHGAFESHAEAYHAAMAQALTRAQEQLGGNWRMGHLRALIADDSYAVTFQSMGQYRTALLAAIAAGFPTNADLPR